MIKSWKIYSFLLLSAVLASCVATQTLFEIENTSIDEAPHVGNLYSTQLFNDRMSDEIWHSNETGCVSVSSQDSVVYGGDAALHIVWDKQGPDCAWLGMGIGWDGWSGKNFGQIYAESALQFRVCTRGNALKSLPIAIGFEDHGNLQAWTGFSSKMLDTERITHEWSTVTIPLLEFNWQQFEADVSNVKQLIIQFEASGDIYIDEIEIVEHQGSLKKRATADYLAKGDDELTFSLETKSASIQMEGNSFWIGANENELLIAGELMDLTTAENSQEGDEIWNGDALEIAFGTNPNSKKGRAMYLSTDKQIGIKLDKDGPMVWDWRAHKAITTADVQITPTANGFRFTAKIPLETIGWSELKPDQIYEFEVALDQGTLIGREKQLRWNSPDREGFHKNPALWGEIIFKSRTNP